MSNATEVTTDINDAFGKPYVPMSNHNRPIFPPHGTPGSKTDPWRRLSCFPIGTFRGVRFTTFDDDDDWDGGAIENISAEDVVNEKHGQGLEYEPSGDCPGMSLLFERRSEVTAIDIIQLDEFLAGRGSCMDWADAGHGKDIVPNVLTHYSYYIWLLLDLAHNLMDRRIDSITTEFIDGLHLVNVQGDDKGSVLESLGYQLLRQTNVAVHFLVTRPDDLEDYLPGLYFNGIEFVRTVGDVSTLEFMPGMWIGLATAKVNWSRAAQRGCDTNGRYS